MQLTGRFVLENIIFIDMILARLRTHTAEDHIRLERQLDIFNRVNSVDDYIALLEQWQIYLAELETSVYRWPDWCNFGWQNGADIRRRAESIERDLSFLYQNFGRKNKFEKNILVDRPQVENFETAVGVAYVLEGSTLGGQIISKHFKEKFKLLDGVSFFSAHGSNSGLMWKDFCQALESWSKNLSETETHQVLDGAKTTFLTIENWFNHERTNN